MDKNATFEKGEHKSNDDFRIPYVLEYLHNSTYRLCPKTMVWWTIIECEGKNPFKVAEKKLSEIFTETSDVAQFRNYFNSVFKLKKDLECTFIGFHNGTEVRVILPKGTFVTQTSEHEGTGHYRVIGFSKALTEVYGQFFHYEFAFTSHGFAILKGILEAKVYEKESVMGEFYAKENNKLIDFNSLISKVGVKKPSPRLKLQMIILSHLSDAQEESDKELSNFQINFAKWLILKMNIGTEYITEDEIDIELKKCKEHLSFSQK